MVPTGAWHDAGTRSVSEVAGMKQQRIVVTRRGGPDLMHVVAEDTPEPRAGEVRIEILAASVSAFDVMLRSHWFPGFPRTPTPRASTWSASSTPSAPTCRPSRSARPWHRRLRHAHPTADRRRRRRRVRPHRWRAAAVAVLRNDEYERNHDRQPHPGRAGSARPIGRCHRMHRAPSASSASCRPPSAHAAGVPASGSIVVSSVPLEQRRRSSCCGTQVRSSPLVGCVRRRPSCSCRTDGHVVTCRRRRSRRGIGRRGRGTRGPSRGHTRRSRHRT